MFLSVTAEPLPPVSDSAPEHHAVIAGTGRAGTSFLVRFLDQCGLDTASSTDFFDIRSRAGLEHNVLDDHVPYVVKDPWFFTYCDDVDPGAIPIDALLVPVRELMAASTSRILQERIALAEGPRTHGPASDVSSAVTAGVVYSLDPVDEARILAVGFHRLIHWATVHEVPLFLLEFPRIVNDREYLVETLWPWLSAHCSKEQAKIAFSVVADPHLVRVEAPQGSDVARRGSVDAERLDRNAMRILLKEREELLAITKDELAEARETLAESERRLTYAQDRLAEAQGSVVETERALGHVNSALGEMQALLHAATAEVNVLRQTLSWRITKPLRRIRALSRGHPSNPPNR
jgi:hypothetical protein